MKKQRNNQVDCQRAIILERATAQDWAYVRAKTGLSKTLISYYRTGKRMNHAKCIELALAKSIAMREKAERRHRQKIERMLLKSPPVEDLTVDIHSVLSKKYGHGQ